MKKIILSILAATTSWASASTVLLSSNNAAPTAFNHANTAPVPSGGLVRIGFFTNTSDTSTFVEYGTSVLRTTGVAPNQRPGKVNGSLTNNGGETDDATFNGKDIYIWIYNAATAAASTEYGIFHAVGKKFADDDPNGIGDSVTVFGTDLTEYLDVNPKPAGWEAGHYEPTADANGTGRLVLGAIVPEPSSMGLLALAGLALVRRRR